jgi:hypothetical protein
MTASLHLPARPGAPVACDMSTAADTPEQRLREYRALFARALLRHERRPGATVLTFRADAGAAVADLARREAACCPFLDHRVEPAGAGVVWTISGESAETLDAFHDLAAESA